MTAFLTLAILMSSFHVAADDAAPVTPPAANAPIKIEEPAAKDDANAADVPAEVIAMLDKLEAAARELEDFHALLRYDKFDPVTNRWEIRAGELIYQVKPDSTKRFAMLFNTRIIGNRKQDLNRHFIFDAGWLVEIDEEKKQFIKRQIVAPGQEFDPFKLGEGQFPLPIGQAKSDVLARFVVTLLDRPEASQLQDLENVQGMRLVPRPEAPEAESFRQIDIFYDKETMLPVGIDVIELAGNVGEERKVVRLRDVKHNRGVEESKLTIDEPDEADGWHVIIEPWRG